jgi:uncharacterized protein
VIAQRISLAAFALAVASILPASAADFKIPPTPDHYVTDNAAALSDGARSAIESELANFEKTTGHQIIVYIAQTTGDVPLETWTGETADHWKVGRKGKDDGAILFVFMQDHHIRIEVGYGLESKLTDADASRIINDDIRPKMRSGDVDGAISSGISGMLATIDSSYKPSSLPSPAPSSSDSGAVIVIFIVAFLFACVIAFVVIAQIVGTIRYGYLILREGPDKARKDMSKWGWAFAGGGAGYSSGGGGFSSGGGGGGFSAGGGGFGGGGASGGW